MSMVLLEGFGLSSVSELMKFMSLVGLAAC